MGDKFEVWSWEQIEHPNNSDDADYIWALKYRGKEFEEALRAMIELKNKGIGCVKLLWR